MKDRFLKSFFLLLIFFMLNTSICLAAPVKIMPLGDSITGSPGCWRALLWKELTDNGYTDIDFVGTQAPQGCSFPYDGEHEGHGGALATNVANSNELVNWLAATSPDIVLMHFGTNDVWSNISTENILAAFTTLVDQMRQNNANMIILVAQIIPVAPDTCSECPQRTIVLNDAIPQWAQNLSTDQSPIVVVDHWTGFDPETDTYDGVHPNDNGIEKLAGNWYGPLVEILSGGLPDSEGGDTNTCDPSDITAYLQVNDDEVIQNDTTTVEVGDMVLLSPLSPDKGTWSWNGPNEFTALDQEIELENIQIEQDGVYSVSYTNDCGAESYLDYDISVIDNTSESEDTDTAEDPDTSEDFDTAEDFDNDGSSNDWSWWDGGCGWR